MLILRWTLVEFFLEISRTFDRVWYETLIFKLRSYDISDSLLCLFNSFFSQRRIIGRCHSIPILLSKLWRSTFLVRSTLWIQHAVATSKTHKHLGSLSDKRLAFDHHVEEMILRANKGIGLISRLRRYLPRNSLLTIYKVYISPHWDYGDVVYDYAGNASFMQKLESVQ